MLNYNKQLKTHQGFDFDSHNYLQFLSFFQQLVYLSSDLFSGVKDLAVVPAKAYILIILYDMLVDLVQSIVVIKHTPPSYSTLTQS